MKDSAGNLIKVTLFESYLSKFLIENPRVFEPVYQKILSRIQRIEELNKHNLMFGRVMFSVYSLLNQEYRHGNIDELKKDFDLFATNYFMKLFCDYVLNNKDLTIIYYAKHSTTQVPRLSFLCKQVLFNQSETPTKYFRSPALFEKLHRGVIDLEDCPDDISTRKFGITTLEHTPDDLKLYFPASYEPSQALYTPNRTSNVGKWFARHNLPIIAGSSGSAGDNLALILRVLKPTADEIQLLMISLAATLVAKGHHSYFEVMIVLHDYGISLHSSDSMPDFYEQTLPASITSTSAYSTFKKSSQGAVLIEELSDDLEVDTHVEKLPEVAIGHREALVPDYR